jgi:hypothetical protein
MVTEKKRGIASKKKKKKKLTLHINKFAIITKYLNFSNIAYGCIVFMYNISCETT